MTLRVAVMEMAPLIFFIWGFFFFLPPSDGLHDEGQRDRSWDYKPAVTDIHKGQRLIHPHFTSIHPVCWSFLNLFQHLSSQKSGNVQVIPIKIS